MGYSELHSSDYMPFHTEMYVVEMLVLQVERMLLFRDTCVLVGAQLRQ
jgi:hypothetical protein